MVAQAVPVVPEKTPEGPIPASIRPVSPGSLVCTETEGSAADDAREAPSMPDNRQST
jgi:hypothetical protein